jgi:hypothetical protein
MIVFAGNLYSKVCQLQIVLVLCNVLRYLLCCCFMELKPHSLFLFFDLLPNMGHVDLTLLSVSTRATVRGGVSIAAAVQTVP